MKSVIEIVIKGVVVCGMLCFGVSQASAEPPELELGETRLEGKREKPEAFYILQHAQLEYESIDASLSFLEELKETVGEDPF